ncbi:MAG: hypothetical protein LBI86_08070 [Treponema sp.]|jgi:TolB-like protein|nr:hypothetical protein [Treponema sp.]
MKNKILFSLFFNVAIFGWSQQLVIAVVPFDAKNGYSTDESEAVADLFSSLIVDAGGFDVVSRSQFNKVIDELNFQMSGYTNEKDYANLGEALNAKVIITGSLMKLGSRTILTSSAIEVETAKILSSSRLQLESLDEVFDKIPSLVEELIELLPAPNLLVGKWSYQRGLGTLEFYNNGTFKFSDYTVYWEKENEKVRNKVVTIVERWKGTLQGTYSCTRTGLVMDYSGDLVSEKGYFSENNFIVINTKSQHFELRPAADYSISKDNKRLWLFGAFFIEAVGINSSGHPVSDGMDWYQYFIR